MTDRNSIPAPMATPAFVRFARSLRDQRVTADLLRDLRRAYATRRSHLPGSSAERRLVSGFGEGTRDARTILLEAPVRRDNDNACRLAVVCHENEPQTRLDEWDAAAKVLDTALSLLIELNAPADLAGALVAIATCLTGEGAYDSETTLAVLDNLRHGHPPLGPRTAR